MIEVITHDIITTMRCDNCQRRLHNEVGTLWFRDHKEAKEQARAYGWKVSSKEHLCPKCQKEKSNEPVLH